MYTVCTVMACQSCEIGCVEWRIFEKSVTYVAKYLIIMYNLLLVYLYLHLPQSIYGSYFPDSNWLLSSIDIPYVIVVTPGRLKSA